mgnify:CR=1 FL=1
MKNIKKIIIILCIIIVIIIISICVLTIKQKKSNEELKNIVSEIESPIEEPKEINWTEYDTINFAVNRYIQAINTNNSTYIELRRSEEENSGEVESQINQLILDMLSDTYIKNNEITDENLREKISLESEQLVFIPLKAKKLIEEDIRTYVVYGIVQNIEYENKGERCYIVNVNYSNQTFSVEPSQKQYDKIDKVDKIANISKNENNEYVNTTINNQTKTQTYINMYKRLALSNPELAYNYMDEEYRNKRFESVNGFKEYIKNNRDNIEEISLNQYLAENNDDYTEYVGKDKYGNLYIFDEKNVLDFTLKLDTYTITTEKFKETYENSEDYKKVQMNIDKFFQMINRQDYTNAYKCLAEGYKNNYFKTEEEFIKYVKNNFFKYNKITFKSYEQKGNKLYVFKVKLEDITGENANEKEIKEIKVIMQLNEDMNFVMSFGM